MQLYDDDDADGLDADNYECDDEDEDEDENDDDEKGNHEEDDDEYGFQMIHIVNVFRPSRSKERQTELVVALDADLLQSPARNAPPLRRCSG